MQKKHAWDKLLPLTGNLQEDFKQVMRLLEESGIQSEKYLKGKPMPWPPKKPTIVRCDYEMVIKGHLVRAIFEAYLETGLC